MYPKKSENLKIFEVEDGFLVFHKKTKKTHRMGVEEYELLNMFDGTTKLELIAQRYGVSMDELQNRIAYLKQEQIIDDMELEKKSQRTILKWKKGILYNDQVLNVFMDKWGGLLEVIYYLSMPLLILTIIYMRGKVDIEGIIHQVGIFEFIVMDFIAAFAISVHEIAHAIFAKKNGAFVGEIGIKMDFFTPMAYTTICGIDTVKKTYKKVQIYSAGLAANAIMAAISLLLMNIKVFDNSIVLYMCFSMNICLILGNCITAFKTDGYYLLSTILDESDFHGSIKKIWAIENKRKCKTFIYICVSYIVQPIIIIMLISVALKKIY